MSMNTNSQSNFGYTIGSPASDTEWEECDFITNFMNLKFIIVDAPVDFSLSGREIHGTLPVGTHDFLGIGVSKVFLRKTASTVQVFGYGV